MASGVTPRPRRSSGRSLGAGLAIALAIAVAGCAPSATTVPPSPASSSASSGASSPSGSGAVAGSPGLATTVAAPTCPPIPPLAPPPAPPPNGLPGWWADRVFYEVFVRSFDDSDGDGVGDLRGVIDKLDYLNDGDPATTSDLGVTGLWLMPTFPSPSYHGYDVTDYRSVNPDYGSLADMRALVAAAHKRGIAVILDLPLNHTSNKDPWFLESEKPDSAKADWYVWSSSPQGSDWFPDGDRYYYAAFGADMPDLNVTDPAVTAELTADARFWIHDVGVDGFRLDAAKYLVEDGPTTQNTPETHAWWHTFRTAMEATEPGALLVGEVWDTPQNSSSYVPDDLDMTFDFALASGYVIAAQSGDGSSLAKLLGKVTTLYPSDGFGAFLTNHDMDRVASQLGGDPAELKLAAGLLLTGPGVPFLYYGEEIGMTGAKPDERIRTPMRWDTSAPAAGFSSHAPWETLSGDPPAINVATEAADPGSVWSTYRDLIRLRATHPALAEGTYVPVASDSPAVVAAIRHSPTETDLVLANVSAAPVTPTLTLAAGPLCGSPTAEPVLGVDAATAPAVTATGGFTAYRPVASIPARSVVVIVLGS